MLYFPTDHKLFVSKLLWANHVQNFITIDCYLLLNLQVIHQVYFRIPKKQKTNEQTIQTKTKT